MRFLKHKEIDKGKWDFCIENCVYPSLYSRSWYLDAVCPNWDAIVWGDYQAVMPLPTKRWWWWKKVYMPFFMQQTGIYWLDGFDVQKAVVDFLKSQLSGIYFSFRSQFHPVIKIETHALYNTNWQLEVRKNYLLSLHLDYPSIVANYNTNRKRNIKKARLEGWSVGSSIDIDAAIDMYIQNQALKHQRFKKKQFVVLKAVFADTLVKGVSELLACTDRNGNVLSYAFFVRDATTIYYLFGTMNSEGKEHSAISVLFDDLIQRYAGSNFTLDFEGGNIEGIGKYFASFGAEEQQYMCLYN